MAKRKNRKQLRLSPSNDIKGEVLHREYMKHRCVTMNGMQWGNLVFSRGLTAIKREIVLSKGEQACQTNTSPKTSTDKS
jgi:hypothetical protein